jgi:hypothetical protein
MKSLLSILLSIAIVLGTIGCALMARGVAIHWGEVLAAGIVVSIAAIVGMLPVLLREHKDAGAVWFSAMVGSVLHMMVSMVSTIVVLATPLSNGHGAFAFWMLFAYLVSLISLVWQLRRLAMEIAPAAQVRESHA